MHSAIKTEADTSSDIKIDRPIFIVGAPRSGNTWLGRVLDQDSSIVCWEETNNIWTWGNLRKSDDVLIEKDATSRITQYIQNKYNIYLGSKGGSRICDKTPRNCLRIPLVRTIFPDAKFIMLLRDGRSVINSTQKELHRGGTEPVSVVLQKQTKQALYKLRHVKPWEFYTLAPSAIIRIKRLLGLQLNYWGARPPGWRKWVDRYPEHVVLAKQWAGTIETALEFGRTLPSSHYLEVKYEDLMTSTETEMRRLINFIELENADSIVKYAVDTADGSRIHKWRKELDRTQLNEIEEIMKPMMQHIGYTW